MLLARGLVERALLRLEDHIYLSRDRVSASLDSAEVLLRAGRPRLAAARAIKALARAPTSTVKGRVSELLKRAGFATQAREVRHVGGTAGSADYGAGVSPVTPRAPRR